jgi:hypothetical protein
METEVAMFDCEKAAFKSFKKHFPSVAVKMCSFHAKQGLNRKVFYFNFYCDLLSLLQIQNIGMMTAYKEDLEVQRIVRQIGALQLTPPAEWDKCVALIRTFIAHALLTPKQMKKLDEVLDYYR